jgi:hypothetical protein
MFLRLAALVLWRSMRQCSFAVDGVLWRLVHMASGSRGMHWCAHRIMPLVCAASLRLSTCMLVTSISDAFVFTVLGAHVAVLRGCRDGFW